MIQPILITGAASGIGRQIALTLALHHDLILLDRQEEALRDVQTMAKNPEHTIDIRHVDLSDFGALKVCLSSLKIDTLEALINVASLPPEQTHFDALSADDIQTMFYVNAFAPMTLFQWAIPYLVKGTLKSVINISSVHTKTPLRQGGLFRSSKAALEAWSEQMALDYASQGFRINSICPGGVASGMLSDTSTHFTYGLSEYQQQAPLKEPVLPSHVADLVAYLLSDSARSITAQSFVIDAGYSKR